MQQFNTQKLTFHSVTYGDLLFDDMMGIIENYISEQSDYTHRVIIGTDSMPNGRKGIVHFVSAIVLHRVGQGGIYFWGRQKMSKIFDLRPRIWQEAWISIDLAKKIVGSFKYTPKPNDHMEIHVDIGNNGPTRDLIKEILGMVMGSGFAVKIKPEAFAAAKVADRHTL